MRSTFGSFGSATSGLFAAQRAIDIVGHNLSNVNTKGYTRQRLNQTNARPMQIPGGKGPVGLGVEMVSITQIRNEFLDIQYRKESETLGLWEERETYLSQIESTFNEPSDKSIASTMNKFYASMHEVAKSAADPTARTVMIQSAVAFCENLSFMAGRFEKLIEDLNTEVESTVRKINTYAQQISTLNRQIYEVEIDGSHANDLRDRRNVALDELSKLVDIQVVNVPDLASDGKYTKMNVLIHGTGLVLHDYVNEIALEKNREHPLTLDGKRANPPRDDLSTVRVTNLKWSTGSYIRQSALGGTLGGQLDMRDNFKGDQKGIPYYVRMLNEYAFEFAKKFNEIHSHEDARDLRGERGLEFFKPDGDPNIDALDYMLPGYPFVENPKYRRITAKNIRVNEDILTQPSRLAAAKILEGQSPDGIGIDNNKNLEDLLSIREDDKFAMKIDYFEKAGLVLGEGKIDKLLDDPILAPLRPTVVGFQNSIAALQADPADSTAKQGMIAAADALINAAKNRVEHFKDQIKAQDAKLDPEITKINDLLKVIAEKNTKIYNHEIAGQSQEAADGKKERDKEFSKLRVLLGNSVRMEEIPGGDPMHPDVPKIKVSIGGVSIVEHDQKKTLELIKDGVHPLTAVGGQADPDRGDLEDLKVNEIQIQGTAQWIPRASLGGTVGDIIKIRDDYTDPDGAPYKARLVNEFMHTFARTFNEVHSEGRVPNSTAQVKPFFITNGGKALGAENLDLNVNADEIAVNTKDGALGGNLKKMMEIFSKIVFKVKVDYDPKSDTRLAQGKPDDVMKSLIGVLGIDAAEAQRKTKNQQMITESVDGYRKSVSGVSQDEEMSNMIKYQHAYNASARMITTIDEMIDVLINRMGRVGL